MAQAPRKSILVVDDEEIIREFLTEVLGDDYDITTAGDGDEAIDTMKQRSFDLVITDLKMPRVPGEEVVKFAKQSSPTSSVIIISGYSSLYTVSQSVSHGASAFLAKPFSIKQLLDAVNRSLSPGG
jgi:DNA-binding NtrC family response regulator